MAKKSNRLSDAFARKRTTRFASTPKSYYLVSKKNDDKLDAMHINQALTKSYRESKAKEMDLLNSIGPASTTDERPYPKSIFVKPKGEE